MMSIGQHDYCPEDDLGDYQPVALAPLDDEDDDDPNALEEAPISASQYLRSVMREAETYPHVAIATSKPPGSSFSKATSAKQLGPTMKLFTQVMNSSDSESCQGSSVIAANEDSKVPSDEWQVAQLEQFVLLHHYILSMKVQIKENNERGPNIPCANNEFIWCCELYGRDFACKVVDIDTIPKTFRKRTWFLKLKEDLKKKVISNNERTSMSSEGIDESEDDADVSRKSETSVDDDDDASCENAGYEVLNERNEQILESETPIRQPVLSFIAFLPQKAVEALLQWHVEWFCEEDNLDNGEEIRLDHDSCLWLYALLAVLEKPVSPDNVFTIRQLCRFCRKMRSFLCDSEVDHKNLAAVNLIILIISRFFDQFDLADE